MPVRNLSEKTRKLVLTQIQTNLSTALASITTDRADFMVSSESPESSSYFIFEPAAGYRAPAIWTYVESIDFRKAQRGANHINASVTIHVNAVVEDRLADLLVIKSERYQSALHSILDQRELADDVENVKCFVLVQRALFSPEYTSAGQPGNFQGMFRKECALICEVEHYEQL